MRVLLVSLHQLVSEARHTHHPAAEMVPAAVDMVSAVQQYAEVVGDFSGPLCLIDVAVTVLCRVEDVLGVGH